MSLDDLQAQLRGTLDQQFASLKQHYETAIAQAREDATAEAQRAADARLAQARTEMQAQAQELVATARIEAEQRARQEFDQKVLEAVAAARLDTQRETRDAALLEFQAAEQRMRKELDQTFQQQLEHVIASVKRSGELERESIKRRAEAELEAEREQGRVAIAEALSANDAVHADLAAERTRSAALAEQASALDSVKAQLAAERSGAESALAAATAGFEAAKAQIEARRAELEAELQRLKTELRQAADQARIRQIEADGVRAELERELEQARGAVEAERQANAARETERQEAQAAMEAERHQAQAAMEADRHQAHAALEAELAEARDAMAAEREGLRAQIRAAEERSRATLGGSAPAPGGATADLSSFSAGVRELDQSRSLTAALDALATYAGAIAGRAALFVINGDRVKVWKAIGIPDVDTRGVESSIGGRDLLARAIQAGDTLFASDEPPPPSFARMPADRAAAAVPVMIGGRAVAVLYMDADGPAAAAGAFATVEALVRHASTIVALRTAMRTLDVLRGVPTDVPGNGNGADAAAHDDQGARRFARLLVSEIKLYNEAAVRAGRQQRDLLQRLGPEIDRARRLYEERVPPSIGARHAYFQQELVQTLADGDPALLGNT